MTLPDDVQKLKVDLLLESSATFEQQVLATAHLDRKIVVRRTNQPRCLSDLRPLDWATVIDNWNMLDEAGDGGELLVLEVADGWEIERLSDQWGKILDKNGDERAAFMYSATSPEEGAIVFLRCRYAILHHYSDPSDPTIRIISVGEGARIFREFGRVFADDPSYTRRLDEFVAQAHLWMGKELPEWNDPFAYWDSP